MKKFIVTAVVMEATGFRYIQLRECESYEDAEIARNAYKRRNPGLPVLLEILQEEEPIVTEGEEIAEAQKLTLSEVAREYLNICDEDCDGDCSVGLPPCPFFVEPDVTGDGKAISAWCRLRKYREMNK